MARELLQENIDAYFRLKEQQVWEELARDLKTFRRALEKLYDAIGAKTEGHET